MSLHILQIPKNDETIINNNANKFDNSYEIDKSLKDINDQSLLKKK